MRAHLDLTEGLIVSERLVAALEPLVGHKQARQLLTRASRTAAAEWTPLEDVLAELPELRDVLDPAQARALVDPTAYLGAAPELTDRALGRTARTPREDR